MDQLSKHLIIQDFALGESLPIIDGWFSLTYIQNRGAAFGLLPNQQWLFISMAIIIVVTAFILSFKYKNHAWFVFAMGLVTGGSVGNLYDRVVYRAVIDFLSFGSFPVFNIADIAITCGGALLILLVWREA